MYTLNKLFLIFKRNMKGYTTGIACGLLFFIMMPIHPVLAVFVSAFVAVVVLLFWTGAIGIRFEER